MKATRKSDRKLAMREQAKRKVKPASSNPGASSGYRQDVEKGRQELLKVSSEGGDVLAKKVKSELHYLLNNYLPQYEPRILQLIDQWRRSGDPGYDPGVRIKLRQARREHMSRGGAL